MVNTSGLLGTLLPIGLLIVGVIAIGKVISGADLGNVFGGGDSSKVAEEDRATAENTRANAQAVKANADAQVQLAKANEEHNRLLVEADKAENEGRRADAEELRALAEQTRADAELFRAESDRLAIQLASEAGTLEANIDIGSDATQKEEVSVETSNQSQTVESDTAIETEAKSTAITGSEPTTEITVGDSSVNDAIETISTRKKRPRSSFFSSGSTEQITVQGERPDIVITGGGSALKGTQGFIFTKKPTTLSEVIDQGLASSASEARDYLSRQGIHSSDAKVQEVQKAKFESKDFGTNRGTGQKINTLNQGGETISKSDDRPRVSAKQSRIEELRARNRLRKTSQTDEIKSSTSPIQKRSSTRATRFNQ